MSGQAARRLKGMSDSEIRMHLIHRRTALTRKATAINGEIRRLTTELEQVRAELATVEDGERILSEGR